MKKIRGFTITDIRTDWDNVTDDTRSHLGHFFISKTNSTVSMYLHASGEVHKHAGPAGWFKTEEDCENAIRRHYGTKEPEVWELSGGL